MLRNVRAVMQTTIEGGQWMDNSTKAAALLKLESMRLHVGYPEERIDDEEWIMEDYLNVREQGPHKPAYKKSF